MYQFPKAYELAFSYRKIADETDQLLQWYQQHAPNSGKPAHILELAAGPAEHAIEFAKRGFSVTALDLEPHMCTYAKQRAEDQDVHINTLCADMCSFSLEQPADLILSMIDSVGHILELSEMLKHLQAIRENLSPNGLYIIEMAHPDDIFRTQKKRTSSSWDVEGEDGHRVEISWGDERDTFDSIKQIRTTHVKLTWHRPGEQEFTETSIFPLRVWTATEFDAVIQLAGFKRLACYGSFGPIPFGHGPKTWRMISILRPSSST